MGVGWEGMRKEWEEGGVGTWTGMHNEKIICFLFLKRKRKK